MEREDIKVFKEKRIHESLYKKLDTKEEEDMYKLAWLRRKKELILG